MVYLNVKVSTEWLYSKYQLLNKQKKVHTYHIYLLIRDLGRNRMFLKRGLRLREISLISLSTLSNRLVRNKQTLAVGVVGLANSGVCE